MGAESTLILLKESFSRIVLNRGGTGYFYLESRLSLVFGNRL